MAWHLIEATTAGFIRAYTMIDKGLVRVEKLDRPNADDTVRLLVAGSSALFKYGTIQSRSE